MKGAWNPLRWVGFSYYHPARHLDHQQRKLWLVVGALQSVPLPKLRFEHGKDDDNKGKRQRRELQIRE